jgi:trimeric autotransporter adhesin
MKRRISFIALVAFTSGALMFTGCKEDDVTPPTLTLNGDAEAFQNITDTYSDPGAMAEDDEDGDISSSITVDGAVTNGSVGAYTLTYNVSDAAGNTASATRTVYVKSDQLAGTYQVVDVVTGKYAGTYNYSFTVTQSSTAYNRINIANFAGLGAAVIVNATVSGSTYSIASQNPSGMQDPGAVTGSGTVSGTSITDMTYTINYTSGGADNGDLSSCTKL